MIITKKKFGKGALIIAVSGRKDGPMGFQADLNNLTAVKNRNLFFRDVRVSPPRVVLARLVHGTKIRAVKDVPKSGIVPDTDALITDRGNIFLAITTADCFPVFFYTVPLRACGIAHIGWRGVVRGIIPRIVRRLHKSYAVGSKNIRVVIGPGIQRCHFLIWPERRHKGIVSYLKRNKVFLRRHGFLLGKRKNLTMDLAGIIYHQLKKQGIEPGHIYLSRECTYHMPKKYFSYRRDADAEHPRGYGNMLSVIGLSYGK